MQQPADASLSISVCVSRFHIRKQTRARWRTRRAASTRPATSARKRLQARRRHRPGTSSPTPSSTMCQPQTSKPATSGEFASYSRGHPRRRCNLAATRIPLTRPGFVVRARPLRFRRHVGSTVSIAIQTYSFFFWLSLSLLFPFASFFFFFFLRQMDTQDALSLLDQKFGICAGGSLEFAPIHLGFWFRYLGELFRYKLVQVRGTVTTRMSVALIPNRRRNLPCDPSFWFLYVLKVLRLRWKRAAGRKFPIVATRCSGKFEKIFAFRILLLKVCRDEGNYYRRNVSISKIIEASKAIRNFSSCLLISLRLSAYLFITTTAAYIERDTFYLTV